MAVLIPIDDPHDPRIARFKVRDRALNTRADRRGYVDEVVVSNLRPEQRLGASGYGRGLPERC